jgi:hypothetical protein
MKLEMLINVLLRHLDGLQHGLKIWKNYDICKTTLVPIHTDVCYCLQKNVIEVADGWYIYYYCARPTQESVMNARRGNCLFHDVVNQT